MAVRCLRSKLSERIFSHVRQDARIMPRRLLKGLPRLASEGTKIASLARHSAIGSTMPIKNLTFQSFKSAKVPERMPLGFLPNAKNVLCKEAGNLPSSFKGKSDPILIHGRRNFSSWSPGTKNIRKMHTGNKGSSGPGLKRFFVVEGPDRSRLRELIAKIVKVYAVVFVSINLAAFYYTVWDTLCSSPYLLFYTVGGHIICLLFILMGVLG